MRVAFCTNIPPRREPATLRGRNQAIIDGIERLGHEVDVLYGPEMLLEGAAATYEAGLLCPNDLVEPEPDPVGRFRADTVAVALELRGVPFVNSPLRRRGCTNKVLAHIAFRAAGLNQPETWTVEQLDSVSIPPEGVLLKPVTGSGGLGIALVHSHDELRTRIAEAHEPCFIQEFIPGARVIRVVATQERSVGRYEKRVESAGPVATIGTGATEVILPPRADLDELGVAMVRAAGMDIGGVDVLESEEGRLYALELNVNFGFYPKNGEIVDGIVEVLLERASTVAPPAGAR